MKIFHIADVHIRGNSRHDEVSIVFDDINKKLDVLKPDLIFIAGDIFHTKIHGVTHEYHMLLTGILNELQKRAPVWMIAGNHDGLTKNSNKTDAITPVVSAINSPRVKLMKYSGIYKYDEHVSFYVHSIFDDGQWDTLKKSEKNPEEFAIGTFHGPVAGCKTDSGLELPSDIRVEHFVNKNYDLVLLGDIHAKQHLNKEPYVSYPGSTLQNAYDEGLKRYGFLWDIDLKTKKVSCQDIELINPCPFYTLDFVDANTTIEIIKKLPKNSRIKLKSKKLIHAVDFEKVKDSTKEQNTKEIVTQLVRDDSKKTISLAKEDFDALPNVHDISIMEKLIKEFHSDKKLSDSAWKKLMEWVSEASAKCETTSNGSIWSLESMHFDNLFSYGENNVIEFSKLRGIVGILGKNKIGKSSIVGSLLYGLHNISDRTASKNFMNNDKKTCSNKIEFKILNNTYRIERNSFKKKVKEKETVSTVVEFYENDVKKTLDQRASTDAEIQKLIGSPSDFLASAVSTQENLYKFANEGNTKRKELLSNIIGLSYIYELSKNIKDEYKRRNLLHEGKYSDYSSTKEVEELEETKKTLSQVEDSLNVLCGEIVPEFDKTLLDSIQKKYDNLVYQKIAFESNSKKKNEVISNIQKIDLKIADIKSKFKAFKDLNELSDSIVNLESLISEQYNDVDYAIKFLEKTNSSKEKVESYEKEKKKLVVVSENLKTVPCEEDLHSKCSYIKNAKEAKDEIPGLELKIKELKDLLFEKQEEIEKSKIVKTNFEKLAEEIRQKKSSHHTIKNSYSLQLSELETLRKNKEKLELEYQNIESQISSYEEKTQEIEKLVSEIEVLNTVKIRKENREKNILNLEKQVAVFKTQIEKSIKKKQEFENSEKGLKLYSYLDEAFNKKGIPSIVLKKYIPGVNKILQDLLQGVVDFKVYLSAPEDSNDLDVILIDEKGERFIESCCGMEKTITSIALRSALQMVSVLPKPNFLIFDEGFGTLDEDSIEPVGKLLTKLKDSFSFVLVISHVNLIKESFDMTIEVQKDKNNYSYVGGTQ